MSERTQSPSPAEQVGPVKAYEAYRAAKHAQRELRGEVAGLDSPHPFLTEEEAAAQFGETFDDDGRIVEV